VLDATPRELALQVDVKAYGDPELTRASAAAVARVVLGRADHQRVEVLSFHVVACEEAVRHGLSARLVTSAARAGRACAVRRSGRCLRRALLLHAELVERLRGHGLSVSTGTINDRRWRFARPLCGRRDHHRPARGPVTRARRGGAPPELIRGACQSAARSTTTIRGCPSTRTSSTISTSSSPTMRPRRRSPSAGNPE
jgi:hypothetical protein